MSLHAHAMRHNFYEITPLPQQHPPCSFVPVAAEARHSLNQARMFLQQ